MSYLNQTSMSSIVDIAIAAKPEMERWMNGINVPVALQISVDDRDDDEVSMVQPSAMKIYIPLEIMNKGKPAVKEMLDNVLETTRILYFKPGVDRLLDLLSTYVDDLDFAPYLAFYIPIPTSSTHH